MALELYEKQVVPGLTMADLYGAPADQTFISNSQNNNTNNTWVNPTIYGGNFEAATYHSSISGARVEIFPDPNTGIACWNAAATPVQVFSVIVAGTNVGDVTMGDFAAGAYAQWDQSTGIFTVAGTIVAAAGFIGGWTITTGYLYDLTSGTPTAAPNNGVVMDSGNAALITYEGTAERARMGYLSAGVYGFRAYATDGTTTIFEASDTQQMLGGWNFTNTVLRTGATDAASNVLIDSANSLLRLGPTTGASITMDGANQRIRSSTYVSGVSGFNVDPTLIEAQNILARGTMSGTVFQYDVISATGGRQIIANADALSTAMTALDASTLTIRGNVTLAVNDILVIRARNSSGIQEEYLRVTGIGAAPTYTVTRDLAGTYAADTNPAWAAGTVVVQQGTSDGAAAFTGGWLDLVGEASSGVDWPRISVIARTGVAYNAFTEQLRVGNLNGYLGYAAETFGFGVGASGAGQANITIDATNGIRIRQGTTNRVTFDMAGTATLLNLNVEGSLNVFTSGNLRSGQTAYNTGTGWFMEYNAGTPRFSIGNPAGAFMTWDGTDLSISGGFILSAGTGTVQINQTATTGSSLRVVRNLASASTDSAVVYFQNDNAGDDQSVLQVQQDCNANAVHIEGLVTTNNTLNVVASSLTTGSVARFYSDSADVSVRNLVQIINDNPLATSTRCLLLDQDANVLSFVIDSEATTEDIQRIECNTLTVGIALRLDNLDALTTGRGIHVVSNSADVSSRSIVFIQNDNTLATGTTAFAVTQDAAQRAVFINNLGAHHALRIESASTTNEAFIVIASSVTSAAAGRFYSDSASATSRNLLEVVNDNTLAVGTIAFNVQQDAAASAARIVQNGNSVGLLIDTASTSSFGVQVQSDTLTTGFSLFSNNGDVFTSGGFGSFTSNSADTTARNLWLLVNDNTAANRAIPLRLQQDANWWGLDMTGAALLRTGISESYFVYRGDVSLLTDTANGGTITRMLLSTYMDSSGSSTIISSAAFTHTSFNQIDWDNSWTFTLYVQTETIVTQDTFFGANSSFGTGATAVPANGTSTDRHVGFFFEDGTIWASNANGTTQTRTDVSAGITLTNFNKYEVRYRGGTDLLFLINDTVVATHTTNLPAGSTNPPAIFVGHESQAGSRSITIGNNILIVATSP